MRQSDQSQLLIPFLHDPKTNNNFVPKCTSPVSRTDLSLSLQFVDQVLRKQSTDHGVGVCLWEGLTRYTMSLVSLVLLVTYSLKTYQYEGLDIIIIIFFIVHCTSFLIIHCTIKVILK